MTYIEEYKEKLMAIQSNLTKPDDFDDFWQRRLDDSKVKSLDSRIIKRVYPSEIVNVYDVSYIGFDETVINGLLILPKNSSKNNIPCLINYHGFFGDMGVPSDFAHFSNLGIGVLSVNIRGQRGDSRDRGVYKSGITHNLVADGILCPHDYYYGRVYIDCIRAIDFACSVDIIDTSKLIIHGVSQGGGIGMAVAALDDRVWLALVDVPSNTNLRIRMERKAGAFGTLQEYIKAHPEEDKSLSVGFKAKTLEDCKTMAIAFAESVS